ncbi:Sensor protein ZraS [compost metagenome]
MYRANRHLQQQQKRLINNETFVALGEMSSAVAHSLRNPLASIRSSAELAQEIEEGPAQKYIGDIISQVDRMSQWVRQLLQSLRPLNDEVEAVELERVLQDSLQAFSLQLKRNGVEVRLDPLANVRVLSQSVLLGQIFNSLIANALEAMGEGGILRVERVHHNRKSVTLRLCDSGKGMSSDQLRMAFRPFYTTKQGGLGVGLVLVKRIMERFGGTVRLSSREGKGTCVQMSFRVVRKSAGV